MIPHAMTWRRLRRRSLREVLFDFACALSPVVAFVFLLILGAI